MTTQGDRLAYWKKKSSKKQASTLPKLDGRKAKNAFEVQTYNYCKEKFEGEIAYEPEKFRYVQEKDYTPDIRLTFPSGKVRFIETKGNGFAFDATEQRKLLDVKRQWPDLDIRITFYKDGKVGNRRKDGSFKTQLEWGKDHGFICSVGVVPKDWFDE